MGRLASIVKMKGVTLADRMRDEIENALKPLTAFRNGPSYTTLIVSLAAIVEFEDVVRKGVR